MLLHKPRRRVRNRQTEFFIEFARERLMNGFTLFKLAAREFPVTRIGLAFGAGTQQHPAVFTNKHADGHFNNVVAHRKSPIVRARFPRTQLVNCPPSRRFMLDCRTGSLSRSRLSQRKSVDSDIFLWVHLINHCTGIECSREAKVDNSALKCIDQIVLRVPAAKICRSMSTKLCLTASERRNRAKSSQFAFGNRKTFAGIEIAETPTGKIINHQTAARWPPPPKAP